MDLTLNRETGVSYPQAGREATGSSEESLVHDDRGRLSPAELIEQKLSRMLRGTPVPISHLTFTRRVTRR